jgi:SAM-dependent methyltransferase
MLAKRTVRFASGGAAGDSCRPDRGRDFQKDAGLVILFALTIFLGAFLLFQVQPMMAKFILPWFGGGPGVWTVCLLFFQACLLGGYAYAHALSRFFSRRTQVMTHVVLLVAALFFLPIVPGAHWEPQTDGNPTGRILLLLTVCLGLPYLMLSSTGPLLQAWFSQCRPGVTPYRLYALSNAGSLLALISYPFVFEPALTRRAQAGIWAWSFGAFVLLCGGCAWLLWRTAPAEKKPEASRQEAGDRPPTAAVKAWWFALPACGSVLLLATTNKLCLDVPSIPFLWVLPLSLYLLTFIICFDRPAWYAQKIFLLLLVPLLVWFCYALFHGYAVSLWWQIVIYGSTLFVGCMVCHGEAYRLRPAPRFLTSFYLFVAAGGAAGGVFVGIISPLIFSSYAELSWGYWLLTALILGIFLRDKTEIRWRNERWPLWPAGSACVIAFGAALLVQAHRGERDVFSITRNFYGVLRVVEGNPASPLHAYKLNNGGITHGLQFVSPSLANLATTYYNEPSGVGLALNNFSRQTNRCVGVVGLGSGTLAAYGRAGDRIRFYEINPEVRRLAQTGFSFLKNSAAQVEVVPGDARLSLEREESQHFDVLILDAFSSDAIPVHLLTQEAFETYFRHLKPDGVIAVHISNRHLDLLPVTIGVAKHFRLMMRDIEWDELPRPWWFSNSKWVLLSRNQPFMLSQPLATHATFIPETEARKAVLWTDDYASLFNIIKR